MMKSYPGMIGWIFLGLAAAFAYLIIATPGFFPLTGFALTFILLALLIYYFKKERGCCDHIWLVVTVLLSFMLMFRANVFMTVVNFFTTIYFGSILTLTSKKDLTIIDCIFSPLHAVIRFLSSGNSFPVALPRKGITSLESNWHFGSLGITLLVIVIIVPLLSSTNPFFKQLVDRFIELIGLKDFFTEAFSIHIIRFIAFLVFAVLIPRIASYVHGFSSQEKQEKKNPQIKLLIPKLAVIGILSIFMLTQVQLYSATPETLVAIGVTHKERVNEVFGQLLAVTLIVGALIYNDRERDQKAKASTYILIALGFLLDAMAFKSVYDYSLTWGFTHKRLWGFTGVFWVLVVFVLYLRVYIGKRSNWEFIKTLLFTTGMTLVFVNFINFDYLIYHVAKPSTGEGIDHYYISRLSADSRSTREHLDIITQEIEKEKTTQNREFDDLIQRREMGSDEPIPSEIIYTEKYLNLQWAMQNILVRVQYLQRKYTDLDWRTFNISEWIEYQTIKDINTEELFTKLDFYQMQPYPVEVQVSSSPVSL